MEMQSQTDKNIDSQYSSGNDIHSIDPVLTPSKPKVNVWMISTGVLFVLLVAVIACLYAFNNKKNPVIQNENSAINMPTSAPQIQPTDTLPIPETPAIQVTQPVSIVPKSYTNTKYPNFKIVYDSGWILNTTEKKNISFPGAIDMLVTLKKEATSLTFDITVGTPMGGSDQCIPSNQYPFVVVAKNLMRVKGLSSNGDIYHTGFYSKDINPNQYNEAMTYWSSDAFSCQKTNDCLCFPTMDNETLVVRTIYTYPDNSPAELLGKDVGALLKVYVKQDAVNPDILSGADKIVEDCLNFL